MEKPKIHDMKNIQFAIIKQKSTNKVVNCLILNENAYRLIENQLDKPFKNDGTLQIKLPEGEKLLINANTKIIVGR